MTCYSFIAVWFMQWNDAMLFEYMRWANEKCIAFFSFFFLFLFFFFFSFLPLCSFVNFFKSLLRTFHPNAFFTSRHCESNDLFFLKNKPSFSWSDQHYFLFFSLSSKHWSFFRYKNFYFISDPWSFNGSIFSRVFHHSLNHSPFSGFMMPHFQNFDPFCLLKIPTSNMNLLFYRTTLIMQIK